MIRGRVGPPAAVQGLFVTFGFVVAAFFPFLAIYLQDRGLSPAQIGIVIAAMASARIVTNPVWGHYADTRIGRLTALQVGAAGTAIAAIGLTFAQGLMGISVAAAVVAAFMVSTGPNIDAIVLVHLGDERMFDYGRIRGWESASYAVGCLVYGAVLQMAGVRWAIPIFAVASLAVLAWSETVERDRPTELAGHGRLGAVGAVFREAPRFWSFLVAVLLVWAGFNAAWNFIALKIVSEGGGPLLIGLGAAAGGSIEVPMMRASSRWQSRWGLRTVFALGCFIYAVGFLLWGAIDDPTILSLLTILEGMAFSLLFTTGVVVVGRLLPATLYSTGNSIAQMVGFGIGPVLGAGVGGFVYQNAGSTVLYAGASALALMGGVVAWFALSTPELAGPGGAGSRIEPAVP